MANEFVCNDLPQPLGYVSRVRWGSVIAGVLIGLVTYAVLSLLGLAVGLSAIEPGRLGSVGMGSGAWMLISMLAAAFVGAWVSSWWGQAMSSADGVLHGILTWSLMLLLLLMTLGRGVGSLMNNAVSLMGSGLSAAGPSLAAERVVANPIRDNRVGGGIVQNTRQMATVIPIENRLSELIYNANTRDTSYKALNNSPVLKRQAAEQIAMGQNANAVQMLSRNTGITTNQAQSLVNDARLEARNVAQPITKNRLGAAVNTARERAAVNTRTTTINERNVARHVTDTASRLAWWGFFSTLLSLVAAAIGGALGRKGHGYGGTYGGTIRRETL